METKPNINENNGQHRQSGRIAKNTVVLFLRMFVLMLINLYIVRLLLQGLGKDDYGTFNAVAGVVTSLGCLSSVLSVATQRFYSFVSGKGDLTELKKIFSASVNINVGMSIIALLLLESIGLWFISNKLNIPAERMTAVLYIYEFSCFSFVCTILQIPFTAAVMANENMGVYALISTGECLLRLLVAVLILYAGGDHLIFYGGGLLAVSIINMLAYVYYGLRYYPECSYTKVTDTSTYKQLISFSGWTFLGSLSGILLSQGNTVLLYMFFGSATTAAFAIALQISHAFNTLCNSVVLAFRPAMIRSYATDDSDFTNRLFYFANKFLAFILLVISVPLIFEMDTILNLWLEDVSSEYVLFARLIIIYTVLLSMHHPITIVMYAIGKVKAYHLTAESITLLSLPFSYVFFKFGMPSWLALASMIGVILMAHVSRLMCLHRSYSPFSYRQYLFSFVCPLLLLTIIEYFTAYICHISIAVPILRLTILIVFPSTLLCFIAYYIFINKSERTYLLQTINLIPKK